MLYGPTLVTLMGDDDPDMGFWLTAAAKVAKIGTRIGKRVAKVVKAKRAIKKGFSVAKDIHTVASVKRSEMAKKSVPVTVNTLQAMARPGINPMIIIGGAGVVGALLFLRGGKR